MVDYSVWLMKTVSCCVLAAPLVLVLAGCGGLDWDQKLSELRSTAERGADAHYVLKTELKTPDQDTCTKNYVEFAGYGPSEYSGGGSSQEWSDLRQTYFVDSCVSGTPRQVQTRPGSTAPAPSATPAAASN